MTKVLSLFCVPAVLLLSACGSAGRLPSQKTENPKDEVVDVGYGSTTREGLGFAVNTVKVDEMAVRSYESISDYIRSRVPGGTKASSRKLPQKLTHWTSPFFRTTGSMLPP